VARALARESGEFEADREAALGLLSAVGRGAVVGRLAAATSLAKHGTKRRDREALSDRLAIVASLIRDLAALGTPDADVALANADLGASLGELASSFDAERLSAAFSAVERADAVLARNASPKIVSDWLAVTL